MYTVEVSSPLVVAGMTSQYRTSPNSCGTDTVVDPTRRMTRSRRQTRTSEDSDDVIRSI